MRRLWSVLWRPAVLATGPHTHWGTHPGHGGLTQHRGARRHCPAPECGTDGRSWRDRLHFYRFVLVAYAALAAEMTLDYVLPDPGWPRLFADTVGGVVLMLTAVLHVRLWRARRQLY